MKNGESAKNVFGKQENFTAGHRLPQTAITQCSTDVCRFKLQSDV